MCIRDSEYDTEEFVDKQLSATEFIFSGRMELDLITEKYRPVSYTHLRAHETVLDLVCRLLLEKKKPQIMMLN